MNDLIYLMVTSQLKFSVCSWFSLVIYTMKYYAAERKKELLSFTAAWMELESIMLSEINQAVKDKYHMISPI